MTAFWVGVACFVAYQIGKWNGARMVHKRWARSLES